ncbi:MAG: DUF6531 domain-containing protein, partial [Bryobacteraceae bacterium]
MPKPLIASMLHFNVSNGATCFSAVDFSLPGFIPFDFERSYKSTLGTCGCLGWNWITPLDVALWRDESGFHYRDQWGYVHDLSQPPSKPPDDRLVRLCALDNAVLVTTTTGLSWRFVEFNESYLLDRIEVASGKALTLDYDRSGLVYLITDSFGRRIAVQHQGLRIAEFQFLSSSSRNPVTLARYAYDHLNNLKTVWDANGDPCHFRYDAHLILEYQNRIGGSQYASYDSQGRCVHMWCNTGERARTIRYDDRRRTAAVTDSRGATTVYRSNEAGYVTQEISVSGELKSNVLDEKNALIATLDEIGNPKLTTLYDHESRILIVSDAGGATTIFEHDEQGRLLSQVDACGAKWQWFYDEQGRVKRAMRPSGAEVHFAYDAEGFLVARTDSLGNTLTQSRSVDGTRFTVEDSSGLLIEYQYDELGRSIGAVDANGPRYSLVRDAAGRLIRCIWPDNKLVQYEYDAESNLVAVIDEIGNRATFSVDSFGRCRTYTSPLGQSIRIAYDSEGDIVQVTNEANEAYYFEYDLLGRVVRQIFPDGTWESYTYDA